VSIHPVLPVIPSQKVRAPNGSRSRALKFTPPAPSRFAAFSADDGGAHHQAELFYLQKQIQTQTPMVIILEDGEQIEGCIEWYDRHSLKVRGRSKTLIYKSAIKYMYKQAETSQ
jgi:RNA chaperone Hfq